MSIDELYEELLKRLSLYMHKDEDLCLIRRAFLYAKKQHEGQVRKSGEPYITHPLNVAIILANLHVMPETICAAILHDVVEDTDATLEDIKDLFGEDIASLVDGVTKVTQLSFTSLEKEQADNHQKMIIAMAKDIRVIVVKLADRLHNMRTLEFHNNKAKQVQISQETLEIYAPLAHKLGMFKIKAELEDIALKYVNPSMFNTISNMIDEKSKDNNLNNIDQVIVDISQILKDENVTDFQIKGRIKSKYSIYKKMVTQDKTFDDIYDIFAIRVIVDTIPQCYQVLGVIHAHFTPIPKRFKDYISVPKPNMYQSLHTTVINPNGDTFEVQIRTHDMDEVAEYGIAAHWAYKENVEYSKEREQYEIAKKLKWYADLLKITVEDANSSGNELVEAVKGDILDANVYVYSPKGEVVALPRGATPLDFAYKIHTDIGNKTVGAIVNNRIVPLGYQLQNGDIVSVRINKNSVGPNEDWLKIVKTSHAKQKIKNFLNKQNHDVLVSSGEVEINKEKEIAHCYADINDSFVKDNFSKNGLETVEDLYADVGKGIISAKTVVLKLLGVQTFSTEEVIKKQIEKNQRILSTHSESGVVVEGLPNPKIKLANCCCPVPGDHIMGFISKTQGIVVHRDGCHNSGTLDINRILVLDWASNITRKYPTIIKLRGNQSNSLINDIMNMMNTCNIGVASMSVNNSVDFGVNIKMKVLVTTHCELETLMSNLRKINNIVEVERF